MNIVTRIFLLDYFLQGPVTAFASNSTKKHATLKTVKLEDSILYDVCSLLSGFNTWNKKKAITCVLDQRYECTKPEQYFIFQAFLS